MAVRSSGDRHGGQSRVARRYVIRGRVQGVGFRAFVSHAASLIGVRGYTRNCGDGSVEVYAVGSAEQLSELTAYLWRGPRAAEVRGVEEAEARVEHYSGFQITH